MNDSAESICIRCARFYAEPITDHYCKDDQGFLTAQWTIEDEPSEDGCLFNPSRFVPDGPSK